MKMTDSIRKAFHHQQANTEPTEAPVEMEDQKMAKVVGGIAKPVYPSNNKKNGDNQDENDDILLPEID